MESGRLPDERALPTGRITLPADVVRQPFGTETVVLHRGTGDYHRLNASGTRLLELLETTGDATQTAALMAEEFDVPEDVVAADLAELCSQLEARGLITVDGP